MTKLTFSEFDGVSSKQWKQKIQVDLKGLDYNDTLIWQSLEGIDIKPFYHQDDARQSYVPIKGQAYHWKVTQAVFIDDETIANKLAIDAIQRGAEAILFSAEKPFNLTQLFAKFPFQDASIYLELSFLDETFLNELKKLFHTKNAQIFYQIDPLGQLTSEGNWFHSEKKDHDILDSVFDTSETILAVTATGYQNAGANMVQQLAYSLAHANEYLNHFKEKEGLKMTFKIAVGTNYFFEIAKIRALRVLYASLAKEYGFSESCHVIAVPSKRNKTIYDYNVNMLRTTTECMSAILGGADAICNMAYDSIYHKSNEFGERISRNQLLILKEESSFNTVGNPSDGSYFIEDLTLQLAEKALILFKEIEKQGGFLKALLKGSIQKKIKESASKEQTLFDEGKIVLLGTNKFPNNDDRMKNDLQLYPFLKKKTRKTLVQPIIEKRISENIEKQRIEHEEI